MRKAIVYRKAGKGDDTKKMDAGAYAQMGQMAIDIAMPFLDNAANKKAEKKMLAGYADAGLKNDKEFETYGKEVNAAIEALNSASNRKLYGSMQNGGNGVMYGSSAKRLDVHEMAGNEQNRISFAKPMVSTTYDYMKGGFRHVGWNQTASRQEKQSYLASNRSSDTYPSGYNANNIDQYKAGSTPSPARKFVAGPRGGF